MKNIMGIILIIVVSKCYIIFVSGDCSSMKVFVNFDIEIIFPGID